MCSTTRHDALPGARCRTTLEQGPTMVASPIMKRTPAARRFQVSRVLACLLACARVSMPGNAHAEPSPEEKARATTLFREAKELLASNRVAEACRKLEESERLDPAGGTLLNLAV